MNENQEKLLRRNREYFFRFTAFLCGCAVMTIIFWIMTDKKMNAVLDDLRSRHSLSSPPVRESRESRGKAARDKIESKMKGAAFLELQRHFESLSPDEQKEIEDGLNDPEVRKMMDQMFEKSVEMFQQIEQQAKQEIESIKNALSISEAMQDLQSQKGNVVSDEERNESEQFEQGFDTDSTDEAMAVRRNQLKTSIIESVRARQESFRESMNEDDLAELNRRVDARMEGVRQGLMQRGVPPERVDLALERMGSERLDEVRKEFENIEIERMIEDAELSHLMKLREKP